MLTLKGLIRSTRSVSVYGSGSGAYFGTLDPSRLRSGFSCLSSRKKKMVRIYILEFFRNKEPEIFSFRIGNNGLAVIKTMQILGIKGKLTRGKLRKAGVEKVSLQSFSSEGISHRFEW